MPAFETLSRSLWYTCVLCTDDGTCCLLYLQPLHASQLRKNLGAFHRTIQMVVAIGQKGQLCSSELSRLQSERGRMTSLRDSDIAQLPTLREQVKKAELSQRSVREGAELRAIADMINERHKYYSQPAPKTASPYEKEIAGLDKRIAEKEQCVKAAHAQLEGYLTKQ